MSGFCGRDLALDRAVYESEAATGDQNLRIADVLRGAGVVGSDFDRDHGLDAYFKGCSTLVGCADLALMAATLANKGVNPRTRRKVVEPDTAEAVASVMISCGMYNGAGESASRPP